MTTLQAKASEAGEGPGALSRLDLAEIIRELDSRTEALRATHERLEGEVIRLREELAGANQQVERSRRLAALGEMAAGIAHEVRNPLGSIRLYAKILQDDLRARGDIDLEVTARKITAAAAGLDEVVAQVLAFARDEKVRPAMIDAASLFSRALELCRGGDLGTDALSGVAVEGPGAGAAELWVECDGGMVARALVNLIRNALEAMTEAGCAVPRLVLGARKGWFAGRDGVRRRTVVLGVSDAGPGIPQEIRARLFDPFFTTRGQGTGLGLAIVHRIVDAHGGRIRIGDRAGGGASVELLLPERLSGEGREVQSGGQAA
ncbi:MAG: hypothetical protein JNM07_02845 [Phycisphaerae bacterium]|nr:hypothetical protein [Phycisphaerae bacterium]